MYKREGSSVKIFSAILIISIILACRFYRPLPDGVGEPWRTRRLVFVLESLDNLCRVGEFFKMGTLVSLRRTLTDSMSAIVIYLTAEHMNVTESQFDGVNVRIYAPPSISKKLRAGIIFYHGGGWSFGSLETHDHLTRAMAKRLDAVVISVDYRLAPEHPYPVPFDDCLKATVYFLVNAHRFGVEKERIAIVGDSSGGNLAAAVALKLRDSRPYLTQPKLQVLIYPALQALDFRLPSYISNDITPIYGSAEIMAALVLMYLGEDARHATRLLANQHTSSELRSLYGSLIDTTWLPANYTEDKISYDASRKLPNLNDDSPAKMSERFRRHMIDPYCMPLMAEDLRGLPEAYVLTAQYDIIRDDGVIYAKRLRAAGVNVTWAHYEEGYHGIWAFTYGPIWTEIGERCFDDSMSFLEEKL